MMALNISTQKSMMLSLIRGLVFFLSWSIFITQICAQKSYPSPVDDLKNSHIDVNQLIELELLTGQKIMMRYIDKNDSCIVGLKVIKEGPNLVTASKKSETKFDLIKDYKLFYEPKVSRGKSILLYGGMILVVVLVIAISKIDFSGLGMK